MEQLEVIIFDEPDEYSEKIKGLTFRQWIFVALIVITVVPTYLLLPKYTPITQNVASYIVILEAAIIGFFGFIKINNLSAEKIVPYWYRHYILFSKPLKYITDAEWEKMHEKKHKKSQAKNEETENSVVENNVITKEEGLPQIAIVDEADEISEESNEQKVAIIEEDAEQVTKDNVVDSDSLISTVVDTIVDTVAEKAEETDTTEKSVENVKVQPVQQAQPPMLSKKELKRKQKQEKMLEKAKKKYPYLVIENNSMTTSVESDNQSQPSSQDDSVIDIKSMSAEEKKRLMKQLIDSE